MPFTVAVFLVVAGLGGGALFIPKNGSSPAANGGISLVASAYGAQSSHAPGQPLNNGYAESAATLSSSGYAANRGGIAQEESLAFDAAQGAVKDPGGVFAAATSQSGIVSYVVQKNDTLPSIAAHFGITVDTITAANPAVKGSLRAGKVLKILPVSGVLYVTQTDDTLASIAASFGVSEDTIANANPSAGLDPSAGLSFLNSGITLVIPAAAQ